MAKNKISEYSSTASQNTDIGNININEGCAPSNINNAIRELMAQIKDFQQGADGDGLTVSTLNATTATIGSLSANSFGAITATSANISGALTTATASITTATITNVISSNASITGGSITGITDLAVADGGTGRSALTADNVILGDGTNQVKFVAPGTTGNLLTSNGTTWTSAAPPAATPSVGVGQTWQSPSRTLATTYTNSTGKPIMVNASVRCTGQSVLAKGFVDGVEVARAYSPDCCGVPQNNFFPISFIVPDGSTYSCTGASLDLWRELR
jgi:hypothetical protein